MMPNYRVSLAGAPLLTFPKDSPLCIDGSGVVGFNLHDKTQEGIRAYIAKLIAILEALPEKREFEVTHTLIEGVYTRTMFIPKGSILVGQIHLKECVNIVAKGDISLLTETGMGRVRSGFIAASQPGTQKVGIAHEDTVFINVFRTDETEISKIEAEIATQDPKVLELNKKELLCQ